ncbi:serine/threonine-protein phosphatase [Fibrisoma montanum]|uniref:Serine/threonine-protein phosphatase n=1 Tax=Fibrisoma montanum TaxID=2305895 RepID=A0A418M8X9_9BACT|nr:protein phosphatase 2C domain-containing protein [Fibrisoma montanum]RIV22547.1 serine/threonine-protein phosphatase [Fibrisoma montanum]
MQSILLTGKTDVGRRRTDNQDTFISTTIWSDSSALLAVIDGVGGYAGGDRAAAIARESIERYMSTPNGDPLSMLREAVVFANNQINEERQQAPKLAQMCCVLTVAVADPQANKLYFVHVGDTRLYRFRQDVLEKLTHDHSLVGIREDANELTETEAMQHPRRNEILREVGLIHHRIDDPDFLESGETDFLPGDQLLLCSDGLTDMITQAHITAVLRQSGSLDEQAGELIRLANEQGGNDNVTVVLARNGTGPGTATVAAPAAASLTQPATPVTANGRTTTGTDVKPAKRSRAGLWLLGLIMVVGLLAFAWYSFQTPDRGDQPIEDTELTDLTIPPSSTSASSMVPASVPLDSLVQTAYRSADHRLVLTADTIRLAKPLVLNDSLLTVLGDSRLTVVIPTDTTQSRVAFRVINGRTINLENLVIQGFRTGIETTSDVKLQLKQVYFRNVERPVNAVIRQDTFRNTVLSVSSQAQPVPPKPMSRP